MKMNVVVLACLCLVLVLNGVEVDARRHRGRKYKLLLLGDSFVDVGNQQATGEMSQISRQWHTPYGMSDSAHGYRPTGRFSDGLVQSDFLAKILGRDESPPAYRIWSAEDDDGSPFAGLNFAVAGSSVFRGNGTEEATSLPDQIDQLRNLLSDGDVARKDLQDSVALVAVSVMHDYQMVNSDDRDDDLRSFANQVTDKIVDAVKHLQRLGVSKVLVNGLPPSGCTPWWSVNNNYASCDARGNALSSMHNAALKRKLAKFDDDDVLLLDLESIFNSVFSSGTDLSRQFPTRFTPCCDSPDTQNGYCGQVDATWGTKQYTLCSNPADYFYWDFWHPTQAGWNAVMEALKGPIKDFLDI
ncbi:hypothetical protein PR202_ga11028 [Eleusine coracana subsp. coracana]|uniref:GDSL esterase/lipase n=1 Tax=Eleusine coracana subsp. coracana TaxID=191504 RepID=A0AAV5C8A7_ELECO|nr:hypothetical protein PR202_ga11028 [Eleusine coracana subsp. coracana]